MKSLGSFGLILSALTLAASLTSARSLAQELSEQRPDRWEQLRSVAPRFPAYESEDRPALAWESGHPERKLWSDYLYSVVNAKLDKFDQAADMDQFCQNYSKLDRDRRVDVWAALFVGVAKWESSWNPADHTFEGNSPDYITHRPLYSEGLLQVSYQDVTFHGVECPLDYDKDRKLSGDDLHRTILNPFINLSCGVGILAVLTEKNKSINHYGDGYWATLSRTGFNGKVHSIAHEISATVPACGKAKGGQFLKENVTRFANIKMNRKIVATYRRLFSKRGDAPAAAAQTDATEKRDDLNDSTNVDMEFDTKKPGGAAK